MKTYLVGGAVRDELLKLPIIDRDWVIVGAEPTALLIQGYQAVGNDFPVFLHPESKEEYALARKESKKGAGYKGFDCYFAPDVTLEEDLMRRDLTINAIAKDPSTGELIDPYHGQQDIQDKWLRHVSDAFVEDPLRVLRVARFAARFAHLGFKVHPDTIHLMYRLARSGELQQLTAERVWLELHKALETQSPQVFLQVLRQCGALPILFPTIHALYGVPATTLWHPEIDSGIHLELVMQSAALLTNDTSIRFAALMHDLGKGITYRQKWPKHHGHDERGVELVKDFCQKWKAPKKYTDLATLVAQFHGQLHRILDNLTPKAILGLLERLNAFRFPERLLPFTIACRADHHGRKGKAEEPYPQQQFILDAHQSCCEIDIQKIIAEGYEGLEIQKQISQKRLDLLTSYCAQLNTNDGRK